MAGMKEVVHYFDYKSPYAYLAQAACDALEARFECSVTRIPYTLHIGDFLGEAALDDNDRDTLGTRSAHQWRRVRYSYMDCRREANRRGLVIRGPRKIWNTDLVHMGFLFASSRGDVRGFHAEVFQRFWRRELDVESMAVVQGLMAETGLPAEDFPGFSAGEGADRLAALRKEAEDRGVFGVPSWWVDGQLYWGAERLPRVEEHLIAKT
jgi:2-hydroxychromene-2-carboxylate isomerase